MLLCDVILCIFCVCHSEPSDPPQNVTLANVTASTVTLLWHPPAEPNGIIVHYTIYYSDNNTVIEQVRHTYWRIHSLICSCNVGKRQKKVSSCRI